MKSRITKASQSKPRSAAWTSRSGRVTRARRILGILKKEYPGSRCSLYFKSPFELLIATILSAQCTDERVNKVTAVLFQKYRGPEDFARADLKDLEEDIRSTGFYKNKAKSILACSNALIELYGGKVPDELEKLVKLRGVGRKTANVVLGTAFGKQAVVVDTHVTRLSNRLGLTKEQDAVKIEFDLMKAVPREAWTSLAHLFIDHGRAVCKAPRPRCEMCKLTAYCDYYLEKNKI